MACPTTCGVANFTGYDAACVTPKYAGTRCFNVYYNCSLLIDTPAWLDTTAGIIAELYDALNLTPKAMMFEVIMDADPVFSSLGNPESGGTIGYYGLEKVITDSFTGVQPDNIEADQIQELNAMRETGSLRFARIYNNGDVMDYGLARNGGCTAYLPDAWGHQAPANEFISYLMGARLRNPEFTGQLNPKKNLLVGGTADYKVLKDSGKVYLSAS